MKSNDEIDGWSGDGKLLSVDELPKSSSKGSPQIVEATRGGRPAWGKN